MSRKRPAASGTCAWLTRDSAAALYLVLMVYITFKVLHERKPACEWRLSTRPYDTREGGVAASRRTLDCRAANANVLDRPIADPIAVVYMAAFVLFAIAQVLFFLVSQPLCSVSHAAATRSHGSARQATAVACTTHTPRRLTASRQHCVAHRAEEQASNGKVNSAFLASLLNTAALGLVYWAWIVRVTLCPRVVPLGAVGAKSGERNATTSTTISWTAGSRTLAAS